MPPKRKATDSMLCLLCYTYSRNETNELGVRSSKASKRATPMDGQDVDSDDDYSDYEEDVREDSLKGILLLELAGKRPLTCSRGREQIRP